MKTFALVGAVLLALTLPALAQEPDQLQKAADLVHQAWNPGGDPLPADKCTDLLTQALKLAQEAPQHRVHGHRVHGIQLIRAALDMIKAGDPDKKLTSTLHDASEELRESVSESK